ncbi:hypothetical protein JL09_g6881 [Pichia kudriavzevii]|uniref:Uncharacterized protein n=1 Tax=Pichia kudriavzevii TaxID=4909 RepID=A0A099NKS1_PICKU|nr:hypothetical protein JL09_g6881 [Pichia kudriavzevii]
MVKSGIPNRNAKKKKKKIREFSFVGDIPTQTEIEVEMAN